MTTDWFELGAWVIALLLVHEGLAQRTQVRRNKLIRFSPFMGIFTLFIGAGIWYWSAQGFQQLANVLQVPSVEFNVAMQQESFKKIPLSERKDMSNRLAREAFVSGGKLIDVVTNEGLWIPYLPNADDIKARDQQIKMISEINIRRQDLIASARIAEEHSKRWLISLIIAVCTGLAASSLRRRDWRPSE